MNEENHQCACLTGEFEGTQRDIIIDSFRKGLAKVLITTNVLSRGIDVQSVSLVINYVRSPMSLLHYHETGLLDYPPVSDTDHAE